MSRTILGPLTTTFSAPSDCNTPALEFFVQGYLGQACRNGSLVDTATCWPSATAATPTGIAFNGWGFYSPGVICPAGHVTACTGATSVSLPSSVNAGLTTSLPSFGFQFPVTAGETVVGCCPIDFSCVSNQYGYQECMRNVTATTVTVKGCMTGTVSTEHFDVISVPETLYSTIPLSTIQLNAPLIQLNWQQSDILATSTVASVSESTTPNATPASTASSTSPTSTTTITPAASSSHSSNTAVKIAVPVVVIAVVIILVAVFLILRIRRHKYVQIDRAGVGAAQPGIYDKMEYRGHGGDIELRNHNDELSKKHDLAELDSANRVAELDATPVKGFER